MNGRVANVLCHPSLPWTRVFKFLAKKKTVTVLYTCLSKFIYEISRFINQRNAFKFLAASMIMTALWLTFGENPQLMCNSIGFFYPAYVTIRMIKYVKVRDNFKWLTYWVVFATFAWLEYFLDDILRFFPWYWFAKCFVLIFIMVTIKLSKSLYKSNGIPYCRIRPYKR